MAPTFDRTNHPGLRGQRIGVAIQKGGFRELREQRADRGLAWVAEYCSPGLARARPRAPHGPC